jgi:hypothetical protein
MSIWKVGKCAVMQIELLQTIFSIVSGQLMQKLAAVIMKNSGYSQCLLTREEEKNLGGVLLDGTYMSLDC